MKRIMAGSLKNQRTTFHAPCAICCAGIAAIIVFTLIAYTPAMTGDFIWDDDSYVSENSLLKEVEGLRFIWFPGESRQQRTPQYYPVVFTSFWLEYRLWQDNPTGYHVINIILHAANALLIWQLCRRIGIPFGWFIAAVFALHPVHVESVAWITERKNVLSGFFYLTAAWTYLRFDEQLSASWSRRAIVYVAALLLFVLALLSKSVTCSLPAALILIMLYQRKPMTFARLAPLLPMFAAGLVLALNTAAVERLHVGAHGDDFAFNFADRLLIASKALLFYPYKLLVPWPVMFIYPRWSIDAGSIVQYWSVAVVIVIGIAAIAAYIKGWRGPALAAAFYAGTIFPALGFINIYPMQFSFVADHFQYLASLGVIVLLANAGGVLIRAFNLRVVAGGVVLIGLLSLSFIQAGSYADAESVYRDTLSKNNEAWMPHNNLANILIARDPIEAEHHYREALRIKHDHYTAQSNLAEALRRQQCFDEAVIEINKAIALVHNKMAKAGTTTPPRYLADDYRQLGQLELARGNVRSAEDALVRALAIDPTHRRTNELLHFIRGRMAQPDHASE